MTKSLKIMVVDDDQDNREVMLEIIGCLGYDASTAADGQTALELSAREPVDAMIIDIGLPGLSGFEVAALVRRREGPRLHLVALTGLSGGENRKKALESGFDHFTVKPIVVAELGRLLATFTART